MRGKLVRPLLIAAAPALVSAQGCSGSDEDDASNTGASAAGQTTGQGGVGAGQGGSGAGIPFLVTEYGAGTNEQAPRSVERFLKDARSKKVSTTAPLPLS